MVKWRGELKKYNPQGGNFLTPSPIKTNDGAAVSRRIARWNGG